MLRAAALGRKLELFPPISEILDIRTASQVARRRILLFHAC